MRTNKFLAVGLLATMILSSCSNNEDPANTPGTDEIQLNAGIGLQTRAGEGVISPNYEQDLKVAFARYEASTSTWSGTDLKAVRIGGSGQTPIAFDQTQSYDAANNKTTLIGYYPRPENTPVTPTGTDPVTALYTIDGNTDIMATEVLSGSKNSLITSCTFTHHLAQLQFRNVGSAEARTKWQNIAIKVKNVPTDLQLKINKATSVAPALTVVSSGTTADLTVNGGSKVPQSPDDANPTTGYVMLYPVANLGSSANALTVEVTGEYDNNPATTKTVTIQNISGGLQKGISHLITLIFTVDGDISASATADIAPWNPGNAGSSVVTPN